MNAAGSRRVPTALIVIAPMNPGLVSCALPRMGGGDDAARKPRNPRISLGDFGGVAEVEHRRALVRPLLAFVESAEQLVPSEIRDAEIPAFVMEVMRHEIGRASCRERVCK